MSLPPLSEDSLQLSGGTLLLLLLLLLMLMLLGSSSHLGLLHSAVPLHALAALAAAALAAAAAAAAFACSLIQVYWQLGVYAQVSPL